MANSRSRKMGLKKFFVAPVTTNDGTTYLAGTPVNLGRAISLKVTEKWTSDNGFSDDALEYSVSQYVQTDVEIEVNALSPDDRALLFGNTYSKKYLSKANTDVAPELALMWCAKKVDNTYEFGTLYAGKFNEGESSSYETSSDKIKTTTSSIKGTFYGRNKDGKHELIVDSAYVVPATDTDAKASIDAWFSAVQESK